MLVFSAASTTQPITKHKMESDDLIGEIGLPTAIGTLGSVAGIHPTARACLKMLGGRRRLSWAEYMPPSA
jgi:hydroxymethylglutaryl-CoA reductase